MSKEELKTIISKLFWVEIMLAGSLLVIVSNAGNCPYGAILTLAAVAALVYLILFVRKITTVNENFKKFYILEFANAICLILAGIGSMVPETAGHVMLAGFLVLHAIGYIFITDYFKRGMKEFLELDEEVKYHSAFYIPLILCQLILFVVAFLAPFDFVTGTKDLLICFSLVEILCALAGPTLFVLVLKQAPNDIDNPLNLTREKDDLKKETL